MPPITVGGNTAIVLILHEEPSERYDTNHAFAADWTFCGNPEPGSGTSVVGVHLSYPHAVVFQNLGQVLNWIPPQVPGLSQLQHDPLDVRKAGDFAIEGLLSPKKDDPQREGALRTV